MKSWLCSQILKVDFSFAYNKYHFWVIGEVDICKISNNCISRRHSRRGCFRRFQLKQFLSRQLCWPTFLEKLPAPRNVFHFYGPAVISCNSSYTFWSLSKQLHGTNGTFICNEFYSLCIYKNSHWAGVTYISNNSPTKKVFSIYSHSL